MTCQECDSAVLLSEQQIDEGGLCDRCYLKAADWAFQPCQDACEHPRFIED